MWSKILIVLIGAGLLACSSHYYKSYTTERIQVNSTLEKDVEMDSLLAPYSRELALEMNKVIGEAKTDMQVGRPNSVLGQWVADVLLNFGKDSVLLTEEKAIPVIALLNTGGIRASFSKGMITVGDVYKLMPFDNQIVVLKLPVAQLPEIESYIRKSGGEPIAGCSIREGKMIISGLEESTGYFWVVTSDFLANGGDKMYFFQSAVEKRLTTTLMRDVLLRTIQREKILNVQPEERIIF